VYLEWFLASGAGWRKGRALRRAGRAENIRQAFVGPLQYAEGRLPVKVGRCFGVHRLAVWRVVVQSPSPGGACGMLSL
jgi:hypothetical protein